LNENQKGAMMAQSITLGTARSQPGTIQYGEWEALSHPTGHKEFFPVLIAQGREEGPCLWLTAGIHGVEHAGLPVIFQLLNQDLMDWLRGTIVAVPALNPAGLRTMNRRPYHVSDDPNRLWPDGKPAKSSHFDQEPPSSLERAYGRLFEEIRSTADLLIDYHNSATGSLSFVIRDRILYREDDGSPEKRSGAEDLAKRLDAMVGAYGHTIVNEFPPEQYIEKKLHRSVAGSALLLAGIPAFTAELSTGHMPDPVVVAAAVAGTRNVMRWAGMLDGDREPIDGIKVVDTGYPIRRLRTPRVDKACVVVHLVKPGDVLAAGEPVAEVRDIWGRRLDQDPLTSEYNGAVIGRSHGIFFYPGDAVLSMGVQDDAPLVAPYPESYFED
jgi:predicted deacylase